MTRGNNVRGPTSALTEFLKEQGINATTIARRVRTRQAEEQQPEAGPSGSNNNAQDEQGDQEGEEAEQPTRRRTRRGAKADVEAEYASDHLDDSEPEEPAPKKRKLTKAQQAKETAKSKAKAKAKAKNKAGEDDSEDEDNDPYSALSLWSSSKAKPAAGSFEKCAKCKKQFTVTKYTQAASTGPGFLCQPCTKAAGIDPFKKPAAPRKRKQPAEKRQLTSFEDVRFPTLVSFCVQLISKHIDDVEALGDIGTISMDAISKALSRNRSLTAENVRLFYNVTNETLTLYDATNLDADAFSSLAYLNPNLTNLRLDFCGRLDDSTLETWSTSLPNLTHLELLGPFLVRAPIWQTFFESHPQLRSFKITQSPRFDPACMESLVTNCKYIQELRLKEIGKIDDSFLAHIAKWKTQMLHLDLSDPGVSTSCTEKAFVALLKASGANIGHLDISGHENITDGFLEDGIKPHCHSLTSLSMRNLPALTDAGFARLFSESSQTTQRPKRGAKAPPANHSLKEPLQALDLARNTDLSTKALDAILEHSGPSLTELNINGWKETEGEVLMKIGKVAKELKEVDVGWCREVTDFVVKQLIDGCENLKEVKVWGCNKITLDCPWKRGVNIRGIETQSS